MELSPVTKHGDLHEKSAPTPGLALAIFIICLFGFFTVYSCWGQRTKKMPPFVTSDNRKDLVSLLDTGLLGGCLGSGGGGLTHTTKNFPPLRTSNCFKLLPLYNVECLVISIHSGWANNMSSFCWVARRTHAATPCIWNRLHPSQQQALGLHE